MGIYMQRKQDFINSEKAKIKKSLIRSIFISIACSVVIAASSFMILSWKIALPVSLFMIFPFAYYVVVSHSINKVKSEKMYNETFKKRRYVRSIFEIFKLRPKEEDRFHDFVKLYKRDIKEIKTVNGYNLESIIEIETWYEDYVKNLESSVDVKEL